MDVNGEVKFLWKFQKKNFWGGGGVGGWVRWGSGWGVSGNGELKLAFFGGGGRVGSGVGGQGGCEQRSKVFVKIQKKN